MSKRSKLRIAAGLAVAAAAVILAAGRAPVGTAVPQGSRKAVPELELPDLSGKTWRLSDHRGNVVLLNFWATWCPPCRYETPDLVDVYRRYQPMGFSAAGISMDDEGFDVVRRFVKKYEIPYPILLPGESGVGSSIEGLPTTLLIDRQGRLAKVYHGIVNEGTLSRDVERLLAE